MATEATRPYDYPWYTLVEGDELEQGDILLNRCDIKGHTQDFMLVDLGRVHTLSIGMVRDFAGRQGLRIRRLPPYREHLAQAFARFFMRVGLPIDIPAFR